MISSAFSLSFAFLAIAITAHAQVPTEIETAPPPLKTMSKEERGLLDREPGIKKRTQLALELMEARLKRAEASNTTENLEQMFRELGGFHAMMDDTLVFLEGSESNRKRMLDNLKRFEIGLRRFTPRLELLRRDLPPSHEFYVRSLIKQLREARSRAVEPMFGETVIRDNKRS